MNRPFIAGNWKMNMLGSDAKAYFQELNQNILSLSDIDHIDAVICAPFTLLHFAHEFTPATRPHASVQLGAQNCHWEEKGAFTGEISAKMLRDLGIHYVIIGHSERRQFFGETDETVNRRMIAALDAGLTPIVCIGEYLEERKAQRTSEVIANQVKSLLSTGRLSERVVIAYEPVWAIGTGLAATPEQAQEVHHLIRSLLKENLGEIGSRLRLLYGGSMNPANVNELLQAPDIDGGLIGGASLKPGDFYSLIQAGIDRSKRNLS